jgi:hypothetical protein
MKDVMKSAAKVIQDTDKDCLAFRREVQQLKGLVRTVLDDPNDYDAWAQLQALVDD